MNLRRKTKAVAYLRFSTDRWGKSGLELEAQREAVARYVAAKGVDLIGEYIEIETRKRSNALPRRPELRAALATAKEEKAELVIAKLDRLARSVQFISGLMETGIEFAVADMPDADHFELHLYAALADKEATVISERIKAGLAAAKARGIELGKNGENLAVINKAAAMNRLEPLSADLLALKAKGLSMRKMVDTLNDRDIPSPAGARWHLSTLHKALARLEAV